MAARPNSVVVAADWSKGMVRDAPRTAVPESALYDSVDFLLDQPGLMRKRGGTNYANFSALSGHGVTYAQTVAYFESSGNVRKLLALGDNGWLSVVATATAEVGTQIFNYGAGSETPLPPISKPVQHGDIMVFCDGAGKQIPKYYDTAPSTAILDATAPPTKHAASWLGRLWLANTFPDNPPDREPQRLFAGPLPDPTGTWDTANDYFDFDYAITGLAASAAGLFIFSRDHTHKLISLSGFSILNDMTAKLVGSVGCTDARSISVAGNNVIFANPAGVYTTNGVGFDCLTKQGGIDTYWKSLFNGYNRADWTIAGEVWANIYYVVTIMNGDTPVDTLICDLAKRAWVRLSNFNACSYTWAGGVKAELYYGDRLLPRVVAVGSIFTPSATYKNDGDGTAVTPQAQLKLVGQTPFMKHFGFGQVTLDMRDAATDNPSLAVTVAPGIEATTFAAVAESPLTETSDAIRKRVTVAKVATAVNMKLAQTNASSKTEIYAVETEQRVLSPSAGGPP